MKTLSINNNTVNRSNFTAWMIAMSLSLKGNIYLMAKFACFLALLIIMLGA